MAGDFVGIILCGGHGKRLWPLSTPAKPKPFHILVGTETLLQQALRRAAVPPFTHRPIVVALARHADLVREQSKSIGVEVNLVLEDDGHDTGLAVLLGALAAEQLHGATTLAILAADQHIPDGAAFSDMMQRGVEAGKSGALVVFGVAPRSASSAYGYVLAVSDVAPAAVMTVQRFVEKPDVAMAADLIALGARWNSGNFVMKSGALLAVAQAHALHLWSAAKAAFAARQMRDGAMLVSAEVAASEALSFDRAVVERLDEVCMVPADLEWSDVGCWDEVRRLRPDAGHFIHSAGPPVRVVGLDDVIVVATPDGVLVTRSGQSDALKTLMEESGVSLGG